MNDDRRTPNLFWPILLIGLGGLFLLTNLGLIETIDYTVALQLWPIFLVAIGVNMLFGRSLRWVSSLISALLAVAVIAFLFFAPSLGAYLPTPQFTVEDFSAPLDSAETAQVVLDFDQGNLTIVPLADPENLFEAEVRHNANVTFHDTGSSSRTLRLELDTIGSLNFINFFEEQKTSANIGLSGDVPVDLRVNIGAGNATLDLSGLEITNLKADSGSSNIVVTLPGGGFPVDISSGSGSLTITQVSGGELDMKADVGSGKVSLTLAEGASGEVKLTSGSGGITLNIPQGVAVRITGTTGSGSVNVPSDFVRISGSDHLTGDSGTWETPGYDQAETQLLLRFEVGSGSFRVSYE